MLRDGRTFYSVFFTAARDLLSKEGRDLLIPAKLVDWDGPPQTKRSREHGTMLLQHGYYFSDRQYSSDPDFLENRYDRKRRAYKYNFFLMKYTSPQLDKPLLLIASPFKRLAAHIFSHLRGKHELSLAYRRVKLTKLLSSLDEMVAESPRISAPMVDFYVYGDGGSEDVKISGSDPMKSKIYRALKRLTENKNSDDAISTAPCSAVLALDFQSDTFKEYEIYFKGIMSYRWQKDLGHIDDLMLILDTLVKVGVIEETAVRPTWATDSRAKAILGRIPEYDDQ